ncbi:MAG: flagellar biosynthetic protein FliR [Pseudorhodobacter sp.]
MNDLIAQLTAWTGFAQDMLRVGLLVFLRVGAVMALLPAFGEQSVPQRVRLVLALAFTAIIAPAVTDKLPPDIIFTTILTETACGLVIGIGLRLLIMALQIAGTMAAQATSLSQLFGGTTSEPQPAMSHLFVIGGLALASALGLHVRAAEMMVLSYDVLPPGLLFGAADLADWGLAQITRAFTLAFTLAAPFVVAATLYNVALGVINRAMPQLMVVFVGAPALTLGGLILLAITAPVLLSVWVAAFEATLQNPFRAMP